MRRGFWFAFAAVCAATLAACSGGTGKGPTGPTAAPRLSKTRFLAFGDSITAGEVTTPVAGRPGGITTLAIVPSASYPTVLQSRLATAYPAQAGSIVMTNAGTSNETLLEGVARFDQVFSSSQAQVVLLQEGVNNLNLIGPDTSTGLMRIMVQQAKNAGATVFVGSMLPTVAGRTRSQNAAALVAYNNVLQVMCGQENVPYVDLYNALLPDAATLIGSDGLHPNEAGYRRMADQFFTALRTALEQAP